MVDIQAILNRPLVLPLSGTMIGLYLLNYILHECEQKIGLVVANTLITNTYVWNLVTSMFYEKFLWKLIFNLCWMASLMECIEIQSMEQFGLYFVFSILACTIGTSIYSLGVFFTYGIEESLTTPFFGSNGICMIIVMYARQQLKGQKINERFPFFTYHNAPVVFIIYQLVMALIGFESQWSDLPFVLIALFFSWSYLRFYYKYNEVDPQGDMSDDFSFVAMFPEKLHIVLIPFTTAFYNIFALIGVYPTLAVEEKRIFQQHHLSRGEAPIATAESGGGKGGGNNAAAPPAPVDIVAERRKAKAMKLLDAKMAELSQEPDGWDEITPTDLEGQSMKPKSNPSPEVLSKFKI